jgi:hypothetical protein
MNCDKCNSIADRLFKAFGKSICKKCVDNRPKKGTGNSGMIPTGQMSLTFTNNLSLLMVKKSNQTFSSLYFSHYPKSKGIVGRSINYLIEYNGKTAGIIGFSSPPKNYKKFVNYFDSIDEKFYVINNVFRLIINEKNLATKVMKLARNQIKNDYQKKYNDNLCGIVTFVEPPRNGALYKADNWDYLGMSEGIRMNRVEFEKVFTQGQSKHIFAFKFKTR